MTSPMVRVRSVRRDRATMLGRYPSDSAAERTLARASSLTADCPLSARETVATDSPAALATSLMLTTPAFTSFVGVCVGGTEEPWPVHRGNDYTMGNDYIMYGQHISSQSGTYGCEAALFRQVRGRHSGRSGPPVVRIRVPVSSRSRFSAEVPSGGSGAPARTEGQTPNRMVGAKTARLRRFLGPGCVRRWHVCEVWAGSTGTICVPARCAPWRRASSRRCRPLSRSCRIAGCFFRRADVPAAYGCRRLHEQGHRKRSHALPRTRPRRTTSSTEPGTCPC